ncbi:MAG: hypothetical protein RMY16_10840 [Nostoc sp. DedQUE12b]|uniref:hypothetical protein n=1 Tax=Nostoc sp. DedQUE12b TaxID=3075398 RepID=UPI002AD4C8E2|nr:hypothetical protein [Nostoc sp. DedQUE12b]MDZ8086044.1 hypothetical protein [Nostoc sp. DedQUE12b]
MPFLIILIAKTAKKVMKWIIFYITKPLVISAIIGSLWAIFYLLYSQNIQITLKLFFYSFLGGLLGGIIGGFIGHLVGSRVSEEFSGDFFITSEGASWIIWLSIFWIIGIIVGAVLGGLIFIRFYL